MTAQASRGSITACGSGSCREPLFCIDHPPRSLDVLLRQHDIFRCQSSPSHCGTSVNTGNLCDSKALPTLPGNPPSMPMRIHASFGPTQLKRPNTFRKEGGPFQPIHEARSPSTAPTFNLGMQRTRENPITSHLLLPSHARPVFISRLLCIPFQVRRFVHCG